MILHLCLFCIIFCKKFGREMRRNFSSRRSNSIMKTIMAITPSAKPQKTLSFVLCFAMLALIFHGTARSQAVYVEDALRYSQPNGLITPRAGALGIAFTGIADDYAALYSNPAGLTMLPLAEFSASGQLNLYNSTSTYFGTSTALNLTSPFFGHIGIAFPVRVGDAGNYTFAIGFSREADFTGGDSINGFNTASSLVGRWVANQQTGNLDGNPAFKLQLADIVNGRLFTPLRNNLQQNVSISERGATSNLSIGLAVDITRNFSLGISYIGTFGEYNYRRVFREIDAQNRYVRLDTRNLSDIDFQRLRMVELLDHNITGGRFIFGGQMRVGDNIRIGASFTLPLGHQIVESISTSYRADFDNSDSVFFNPNDPAKQNIRYTLPWTLNVGASAHLLGITFTGSAEITNFQSIRAAGDGLDETAIQQAATTLMSTQLRAGLGVEYDIPNRPFVLRGSYSYYGSPYAQSATGGAASVIGVGGGYYLAPNSRLDVAYRLSLRTFNNLLYSGATYVSNQALSQIAVQYVVRF